MDSGGHNYAEWQGDDASISQECTFCYHLQGLKIPMLTERRHPRRCKQYIPSKCQEVVTLLVCIIIHELKVENGAFLQILIMNVIAVCVLEILNEVVTEQNVSDSGLVSHWFSAMKSCWSLLHLHHFRLLAALISGGCWPFDCCQIHSLFLFFFKIYCKESMYSMFKGKLQNYSLDLFL